MVGLGDITFDSDSGYDTQDSPRDELTQPNKTCAPQEIVIDLADFLSEEFTDLHNGPEPQAHTGLKRKRDIPSTPCDQGDWRPCNRPRLEPACIAETTDKTMTMHEARCHNSTDLSTTSHQPSLPRQDEVKFACNIEQGTGERQAAANKCNYNAWLRSMNRLTYFNTDLHLGEHNCQLAQQISSALSSPQSDTPISVCCRLLYADSREPVSLKTDGASPEKITMIRSKGNTQKGFVDFSDNDILVTSHPSIPTASPALATHEFFKVKSHGGVVNFNFKFSTNVTSRRHGMRNKGREFCWQISLQVHGLAGVRFEEPLTFTTTSHNFMYVSRPITAGNATTEKMSLVELVSDGRPGDVITCLGENVHQPNIVAELGQGETVVAKLHREQPSKRAFICRLPQHLPNNHQKYWIRLACSEHNFEPSEQLQFSANA